MANWMTSFQVMRSSLLGDDKTHRLLGVAWLLMLDGRVPPWLLMRVHPWLELSHRRLSIGSLLVLVVVWLVRHAFLNKKGFLLIYSIHSWAFMCVRTLI